VCPSETVGEREHYSGMVLRLFSGEWRNGRRAGFRCQCPSGRGGSSPPSPTNVISYGISPAIGRGFLSLGKQAPFLLGEFLVGKDSRVAQGGQFT
jgi:hypothetical protein